MLWRRVGHARRRRRPLPRDNHGEEWLGITSASSWLRIMRARKRPVPGLKQQPATDVEEAKRELARCQNQWLELKARVDSGDFSSTMDERNILLRMGDLRRERQALVQVLGVMALPPPPAGMLLGSSSVAQPSRSGDSKDLEGDVFALIWAFVKPALFLAVIFALVNSLPDFGTRARRYGSN